MEDTIDNKIIEYFNNYIPDNAVVISAKYNLPWDFTIEDASDIDMIDVARFIRDKANADTLFQSGGIHFKGKNKRPHIHLHVICRHFKKVKNLSNWKSQWKKANGCQDDYFEGWTFVVKDIDLNKPKYYPLAYPLKEKERLPDTYFRWSCDSNKKMIMPEKAISFLEDVGGELFERAEAKREAHEKAEEAQAGIKKAMLNVAEQHRSKYENIQELANIMEDEYLNKLKFEDKSTMKNYENYLKLVGQHVGVYRWANAIKF